MTEEQAKEMKELSAAVDAFAIEMKARLREKLIAGYHGWDKPEDFHSDILRTAIYKDVDNIYFRGIDDKAIDISNRCMMLWYRGLAGKP